MSTPSIVSLGEVKAFLRVDHDDEDMTIASMIEAATEAVVELADAVDPEALNGVARIRLAIMAHVAATFTNREDGADLPVSARRLLQTTRRLTV